jgi:hypothetical protein
MKQFRIMLVAGAGIAALTGGIVAYAHPGHEGKQEIVREVTIVKDGNETKTVEVNRTVHGDKVTSHATAEADFVADCGKGRKFESAASAGGEKEKRVSKMVICSDAGESDAEWAKTLRGALAKVEANKDMPADGKAKIMADLRSEIAKTGK